jgi:hypothetical protein
LGVLCGGALILTSALTRRGPAIFVPYGILLSAIAFYLHTRRVRSFVARFGVSLLAFMIGTIILMVYIVTVANTLAFRTPMWNKIWPLLIFLLIGSVASAIIAMAIPSRADLDELA